VAPLLHIFAFTLLSVGRRTLAGPALEAADAVSIKGITLRPAGALRARSAAMSLSSGPDTFADTSLDDKHAFLDSNAVGNEATLVPSLSAETLRNLPERIYDFVHMGCDLCEPQIAYLSYICPLMRPDPGVFFYDYHSVEFPTGKGSVDTFMAGRPDKLVHLCVLRGRQAEPYKSVFPETLTLRRTAEAAGNAGKVRTMA
jgi:hypothetical protein